MSKQELCNPSKEGFRTFMKDLDYAKKMKQLSNEYFGDIEAIHSNADQLLLEILKKELGFEETIKAFNELEKYYA